MFLLKSEPSEYSFADLMRDKQCVWDGVANPVAQKNLRLMRKHDEAFFYHTGDEKAIVGIVRVERVAYPDPKNTALNAEGEPKYHVVDLKALRAVKQPVTLAQIKADPIFAEFELVKQPRLSVMPVRDNNVLYKLLEMCGIRAF